jgi:hypothetical protein
LRTLDHIANIRVGARYETMSRLPLDERRRQRDRSFARIDQQATFPLVPGQPPIGDILVSPEGGFWVERIDVASPAQIEFENTYGGGFFSWVRDRPTRWDIFDADGAPQAGPSYHGGAPASTHLASWPQLRNR